MVSECISPSQTAVSDARRLASASNVAVVLPAGAGKTELIARATRFASETAGRQLILTHTHAGVHALRDRLARLGVAPQSYKLTTIAGWALMWALHYPSVSGLRTTQPNQDEWDAVYDGARQVLANPHLASRVRESYGGGFVDEYQDCTLRQHSLSLALSQLMPLRVLGDPLQGIFGFTGDSILWSRDVESSFVPNPASCRSRLKSTHGDGQRAIRNLGNGYSNCDRLCCRASQSISLSHPSSGDQPS